MLQVRNPSFPISPRPRDHTPKARRDAGWSSPVARQAHNLKVAGSNPAPAIFEQSSQSHYAQIAQLVEQRTENPRVAGSIPALGIFFFV